MLNVIAHKIKIIIIMDLNEPLFVLEFQFRGLPNSYGSILRYILNYIAKEDSANECSEVDDE